MCRCAYEFVHVQPTVIWAAVYFTISLRHYIVVFYRAVATIYFATLSFSLFTRLHTRRDVLHAQSTVFLFFLRFLRFYLMRATYHDKRNTRKRRDNLTGPRAFSRMPIPSVQEKKRTVFIRVFVVFTLDGFYQRTVSVLYISRLFYLVRMFSTCTESTAPSFSVVEKSVFIQPFAFSCKYDD